MSPRLNHFQYAPKAMALLIEQESYLQQQFSSEPLSAALLDLIKLRVSQINQCAFCIDMHWSEAIKRGETTERLYGLSAWRDMPFYSSLERVVLEWAEHLTAGHSVSDALYDRVVTVLGEEGIVNTTIAVNAINSWNRVSKAFKPEIGSLTSE